MKTQFTIFKSTLDEETNTMFDAVVFQELNGTKTLTLSTRMLFESMVGENVKMERCSDVETEATVIGRGGKFNHRA